ncbi:unnamed protein product, partial [Prorocentrum cordatum]
ALRFLPAGMDLDQMVDDERKNINSVKSLVVDLKETVALVTWSRPPEPQRSCQTDTSDHVCNFRQDVLDKMGAVKGKFEALMSKAPQRLLIMHKDEINFVRGALSEATALVIEKSHKRYSNMLDMIMFLCARRSLDDALQVAQRLETVVKEPFELAFKTFMDADSIVLMETFRKELHSVVPSLISGIRAMIKDSHCFVECTEVRAFFDATLTTSDPPFKSEEGALSLEVPSWKTGLASLLQVLQVRCLRFLEMLPSEIRWCAARLARSMDAESCRNELTVLRNTSLAVYVDEGLENMVDGVNSVLHYRPCFQTASWWISEQSRAPEPSMGHTTSHGERGNDAAPGSGTATPPCTLPHPGADEIEILNVSLSGGSSASGGRGELMHQGAPAAQAEASASGGRGDVVEPAPTSPADAAAVSVTLGAPAAAGNLSLASVEAAAEAPVAAETTAPGGAPPPLPQTAPQPEAVRAASGCDAAAAEAEAATAGEATGAAAAATAPAARASEALSSGAGATAEEGAEATAAVAAASTRAASAEALSSGAGSAAASAEALSRGAGSAAVE